MTFNDLYKSAVQSVVSNVPGANPAPVQNAETTVGTAATAAVGGGVSLVALFLGYKALRYFGVIPRVF